MGSRLKASSSCTFARNYFIMAPVVQELQLAGKRDSIVSENASSSDEEDVRYKASESGSKSDSDGELAVFRDGAASDASTFLDAASACRAGQPGAYAAFCKILAAQR